MDLSVLISLCGGLGLFLYGMKTMSKAIETVAGAKLRHILEIFTTNRFTGMFVGLIFTAVIQSSSACTAMVVSFVNAGLMNLYQAAGVYLRCQYRYNGHFAVGIFQYQQICTDHPLGRCCVRDVFQEGKGQGFR